MGVPGEVSGALTIRSQLRFFSGFSPRFILVEMDELSLVSGDVDFESRHNISLLILWMDLVAQKRAK